MTSLVEVYRRWPTHTDCIAHLEAVRWGGLPTCPYCGADRVSRHRELLRDDRWQCQRCDRSFSVTVGTIFHRTHIDLQRWFLLISLMLSAKKGLSAMQAARDLDTRRATVWSMMHRVREALADDGALLRGVGRNGRDAYLSGYRPDDTASITTNPATRRLANAPIFSFRINGSKMTGSQRKSL